MASIGLGTPTERAPRLPTLAGYLAFLWSNFGVVVVMTLVGADVGLYVASRVPTAFEASASVGLPDVPTWVDTGPADPIPGRTTIDTTAQLVFSEPVFDRVADVTSLSPRQVHGNLSVSAHPLSRVLIVSLEASSAELAISGANEAARGLVDQQETVLAGTQLDAADALYDRLSLFRGRVQSSVAQFSPVARRITAVLDQINEARQQAVSADNLTVAEAYVAKRIDQHPELDVVTGAVAGLMAGLLIAWWRPRRSRRGQPRDRRVIGAR